jgi:predicted sulfurtransferase
VSARLAFEEDAPEVAIGPSRYIRDMRWVVFLAAVLATAPAVRAQETDEAPRISQQEFKKLLAAKNVIVVDTRNPEAYPLGHIPGAILLPLEGQLTWPDEYQKTVDMLKRTHKPIVTYCA